MKMRKFILAGCLVANVLFFTACSDEDDDINNPVISERDETFMIKASQGNWAEVDMGRTADSISANDAISMFGQMMVADHTNSQHELEDIGESWLIDLPDEPDSLHKALKQQLLTLSGYSFDTAYIHGQVRDHQATIALFEDAAANSDQQRLKDYANKYLPGIRMHLHHADSIAMTMRP
jgi:putative membrane protein